MLGTSSSAQTKNYSYCGASSVALQSAAFQRSRPYHGVSEHVRLRLPFEWVEGVAEAGLVAQKPLNPDLDLIQTEARRAIQKYMGSERVWESGRPKDLPKGEYGEPAIRVKSIELEVVYRMKSGKEMTEEDIRNLPSLYPKKQ